MKSGIPNQHCEHCSPKHLLAMSRLLELPLTVSSRKASGEAAATLVMEEADHVLSCFLQSTFIVAFSSWPVDETWKKHLRHICGIPTSESHREAVKKTWYKVTDAMEERRLTLTPFLNYLHSCVCCGLKTQRFLVEVSLDDQLGCFPINVYHINSSLGKSAVYTLQNETTRKYWQQYSKKLGISTSGTEESWIESYLGHVKTIAASIRAHRLYLIPFFAEQRFFRGSGDTAYGGAMTLYCSEGLGQSHTAQLVLHQLSGLLFRTIEEPKRLLAEGREEQLIGNLSYFGHDSQRLAETSRAILDTNWVNSTVAAGLFCASLEARSAAYATLVRGAAEQAVAKESVIDEMRRAIAGGRFEEQESSVCVHSLLIAEFLAIFARICVGDGQSLWAQLGQKLFTDKRNSVSASAAAFASVFGSLPESHARLDSSELIERLAGCGFDIELVGPKVFVPCSLPASDERATVPMITTALRFIFSELLTNLAKHAWFRVDLQRVKLRLDVVHENEVVTLALSSSPGAVIDEKEIDSVVGLSSLRLAIAASGGETEMRQITIRGKESGSFPLPTGNKERLTSRINYPAKAFYVISAQEQP